jgi:uncharacterized protein
MDAADPWLEELVAERQQKDEFMARHPESPFVTGRIPFHELQYFPPDPKLRVRAKLDRVATPEEAYLRTNRDGQAVMRYIGDLRFTIQGKGLRLRLYHAGEGVGTSVFVPFRDGTSGRDSYGPGRYVTLELNETDEYELDFNRAFNPYCAYTDEFECGFPPSENDLPVPIRAGEKVWAADQNPRTPSSVVLERLRRATAPKAAGTKTSRAKSAARHSASTRPRPAKRAARSRSRR